MNNKSGNNPLIEVTGLHKQYRMGSEDLHVLQGIDLQVSRGQWLGVLGASGSGKSTLLHLIGGLDTPDKGKVTFDKRNVFNMSAGQRDRFRNTHIGFVFQFYHLLPELNVLENTMLTCMIGKSVSGTKQELRHRACQLLARVGLSERLRHKPQQLSGGERQRVAIARSLINQPDVLLADEPTGNLDKKTGNRIVELLKELHDQGQTIIMVSHELNVIQQADRVLTLENGQLRDV